MRIALFIGLIFLSQGLNAAKDPYVRLNKIYQSDKTKCLQKSQRYMSRKPELPSPYFFAGKIYFEEALEQKNLRKKYSRMSKSLTMLIGFHKSDTSSWKGPNSWNSEIQIILDSAHNLALQLVKEKDSSRAKTIARKYEKVTHKKVDFPKPPKKEKTPLVKKSTESKIQYVDIPTAFKDNKYFGLPNGKELVQSHSREKEQELLRLINAERRKKKLTPLIWEEGLARAARYHAYDMATQGYFSHDSYDRLDTGLAAVGYTFKRIRKFYNNTFVNSENIAAGSETAYQTYRQWYTSSGHYANMFRKGSKRVGLGVYYDPDSPFKYYWVFCTAY